MLLLALDTSTRQASIALCSESELYGEYTWHVGNNHSVELLRNIQWLLAECQMTLQQLDAVAVASGPGSFNGLRVALASAKTLAFALKKSLVGVSTLEVIAARQQLWHGPVCAVLEAGRSELYAACFQFAEQHKGNSDVLCHLRRLSDDLLLTPQQLASYLQEQAGKWSVGVKEQQTVLFCGEMREASRQVLQEQMRGDCSFVSDVREASVLAMLALQRLHEGKEDNPLLLEPLYLRRPSITKSMRKQPLLGGVV
jgi:tRNA threonylcarbamoyladenosine biosynthesis protein TsaB